MKVLLIHEHGRAHGGGAVTAMHRLHEGLLSAGIHSTIACRLRELDVPEIVELPRADLQENLLGKISWRLGLNEVHCVSSFKITRFQPFLDADVINIHGWNTNFFNYLALPGLAKRKPIVGTMHDMWNITGHCSQSYDCERWKTGCGRCPYPETFPPVSRDATAVEWKLKNWAYRRSDITFIAPSRWLLDLSRQSMLQHHDLRQIPNGVDVDTYCPLDKNTARDSLGVARDKHVILFVSVALKNRGKGGDLLVRALNALPAHIKHNAILLMLGEPSEELAQACGIESRGLGYIHDDAQKAVIYSAADVLVQPSRAENQSLVILESMACGTPVVAFDVGGMGEVVQAGPGGMLAPMEDTDAMANGIATILADRALQRRLSAIGRQSVLDEYSIERHVQRYIALYEEKIAQRAAAP